MSVRVMQAVWQHSKQSGGALVLLLAIADNAHDDGGGAYPSIDTLAKKARMTGRNVNILLKALVDDGEVAIDPGAGPRGVNLYRVILPGLATPENIPPLKTFHPEKIVGGGEISGSQGGEKIGTGGVKPVSPKPSLNHQESEPSVKPSLLFARFWTAYPKKQKKAEAEEWFKKNHPNEALLVAMLDAIERAALSGDWQKEGGRFIPMPITWLNQRRWEDELDVSLPSTTGRELIGKDKERAEVMHRALEKRGYEFTGPQPTAHPNGREVSHQPLRVGDGRVPR